MAKKQTSEPIILWSDSERINGLRRTLEMLIPVAQAMADAYYKLPFATEDTDLGSMIARSSDMKKAYQLRAASEAFVLTDSRFKLDTEQAAKLIRVDGYTEFEGARQVFEAAAGGFLPYLRITDGKVEINPLALQQFARRYTISVSTPEEEQLYHSWMQFLSGIENFNSFLKAQYNLPLLFSATQPLELARWCMPDMNCRLRPNYQTFLSIVKRNLGASRITDPSPVADPIGPRAPDSIFHRPN